MPVRFLTAVKLPPSIQDLRKFYQETLEVAERFNSLSNALFDTRKKIGRMRISRPGIVREGEFHGIIWRNGKPYLELRDKFSARVDLLEERTYLVGLSPDWSLVSSLTDFATLQRQLQHIFEEYAVFSAVSQDLELHCKRLNENCSQIIYKVWHVIGDDTPMVCGPIQTSLSYDVIDRNLVPLVGLVVDGHFIPLETVTKVE